MKKAIDLGLEVIQLEDQVLLINSKSGTVQGDLFIDKRHPNEIRKHVAVSYENHFDDHWKHKIVALTKPVKVGERASLLIIEDEVEILARQEIPVNVVEVSETLKLDSAVMDRRGFVLGYKASQKSHPYSEEDLKNYLIFWRKHCTELGDQLKIEKETLSREEIQLRFQELTEKAHEESVNSLSKKELWIEVELNQIKASDKTGYDVSKVIPKITNNQLKAIWK